MSIVEFTLRFRALKDNEKREFVSFLVPVYLSETHVVTKAYPFGDSIEIVGNLKTLMKDFENVAKDSPVIPDIASWLEQNQMCTKKTNSESAPTEASESIQFTTRILILVSDLSQNGEDYISVSDISIQMERRGYDKTNVGGSVTSLLKSGLLTKQEDSDTRERFVGLTDKGRKKVEQTLQNHS